MKDLFITLGIMVVLMGIPFHNKVTINKSDITGNRPFAGILELNEVDEYVGTDVCCDYWLEPDEQPDVRTVKTVRLGLIGLLFGISFQLD